MASPVIVRYNVQRGDTLYAIANKFGTDVSILRDINNLTTDVLRVGQELLVPTTREITNFPVQPNVTVYTVRSGDTLWSIARRFGATIGEIKMLNNLTSDLVSIGQQLLVPFAQPLKPAEGTVLYVVKAGDTLWAVANKFRTTVDELRRMNNLTNDLLRVGQILTISA